MFRRTIRRGRLSRKHPAEDDLGGQRVPTQGFPSLSPGTSFVATVWIDTPVEITYYRNGGILQTVLRKMIKS
jgi:hypothetical protein